MNVVRMLEKLALVVALLGGSFAMGGVAVAATADAANTPAAAQVSHVAAQAMTPTKAYCKKHPKDPRCKK